MIGSFVIRIQIVHHPYQRETLTPSNFRFNLRVNNLAIAVKKKKLLFQKTKKLTATTNWDTHDQPDSIWWNQSWSGKLGDDLDYQTCMGGEPDSRPIWTVSSRKQQVYQVSGGKNRGFFGEYGDCYQIITKYSIIYTSKNIIFQKNAILFIYIQISQFYSFYLFFEYCQKSHICKKHTFLKIAYFLKK